jgi:hypothetical protein
MQRLSFGLLLLGKGYLKLNGLSMAQLQLCVGQVAIPAALWLDSPLEISIFSGVKMVER